MKIKQIYLFVTLIFASLPTWGQYYTTGTDAASTRWLSYRSGSINLVFPAEALPLAARYMAALRSADSLAGADYGLLGSRIDVVLHNRNVLSNGYVAWTPRRMELVAHPSPSALDAQPWTNMLTLHEMRHVKQMYALNTGLVRGGSVLLGEQSVGMAAALLPLWLLEGDAVFAETKQSASGRGRSAAFYQHYRAMLLSGHKGYSFDKWRDGSFRHYTPNFYSLGYQLVEYIDLKHGIKSVSNIANFVGRRPFAVPPIYWALRREVGMGQAKLCETMFAHADSVWRAAQPVAPTPIEQLSPTARTYTSYMHPHLLADGRLVVLKTSLKRTQAFVALDTATGRERVLARPGSMLGFPHIDDSLIVWAEYRPHLRWEQVSYGRVVVYNHRTGKRSTLPHRGMLSSPVCMAAGVVAICFNPDGSMAAVRLNSNGTADTLCLFDVNTQPTELASHGDSLYALATTPWGKQLMRVWPGPQRVLMPPIMADISAISMADSGVFFSASHNYAEHVFFYNFNNNTTFRVVSSSFGSKYMHTTPTGGMVVSNYTPMGYAIGHARCLSHEPFELAQLRSGVRHSPQLFPSDSVVPLSEPSRYRKLSHLINVHSWAPLFIKPTEMVQGQMEGIGIGLTAISQNLLGSAVMSAGYGYTPQSTHHHVFNATVQYQGWWPVVGLSFDLEPHSAKSYSRLGTQITTTQQRVFALNIHLPLRINIGQTSVYIKPYSNLSYNNDRFFSSQLDIYRAGHLMQTNGLYVSALSAKAHRDLYPRWGCTFQGLHSYSLSPWARMGSLAAITSMLYMPGLLSNHSARVGMSFQQQWPNGFYLSSRVALPRGYTERLSERFVGINLNYAMPLVYPDLNLGQFMYIKRLWINMFCDYAHNMRRAEQTELYREEMQSLGAELSVDFHLLRIRVPMRLTFTAAWPDGGKFYYNFGFTYSYAR